MARAAVRLAGMASSEGYRSATPEQLAAPGEHAPLLRRLIREGRPDVLAGVVSRHRGHADHSLGGVIRIERGVRAHELPADLAGGE